MNRFRPIYNPIHIKENKIKSQIQFIIMYGGNKKQLKILQQKLKELDVDGQ